MFKERYISTCASVVTMKICIEVENVGNISGYILQLKEVLPEGFQLDEKQNMNWTAGKDNSFYYSGLAKERIQPSETKRVYLIVYKNIGDSSLGTFNNEVIIEETSNDELIEETNVKNNNSSQNFILSISTGAATYVLLVGLLIELTVISSRLLVFQKPQYMREYAIT